MRNVQFVVKAGGATVKTFTTDGEGSLPGRVTPFVITSLREKAHRHGLATGVSKLMSSLAR